jgi:hypothetical protein
MARGYQSEASGSAVLLGVLVGLAACAKSAAVASISPTPSSRAELAKAAEAAFKNSDFDEARRRYAALWSAAPGDAMAAQRLGALELFSNHLDDFLLPYAVTFDFDAMRMCLR